MPSFGNTFPPKFSENLVYPSIYNLDEFDMPDGGDVLPGEYFNVLFYPEYSFNEVPELRYGKHRFDIFINPSSPSPKLRVGSRVLFEVKDSAGTVIFSEVTPFQSDNDFTGYIWVKKDPLRTYDEIQEGWGTLTIVGKRLVNDINWRNKYNVRTTLDVEIKLLDNSTTTPSFLPNDAPLMFQQSTSSMGSGSGLSISLTDVSSDLGLEKVVANFSCSKMRTYSGTVQTIDLAYQLQAVGTGGGHPYDWKTMTPHDLQFNSSSIFENGIHLDYAHGLNTLSEVFEFELDPSIGDDIDSGEVDIKFRLRFKDFNGTGATALDYHSGGSGVSTEFYELIYPSKDDEWLTFLRPDRAMNRGARQTVDTRNPDVVETFNGQFSFRDDVVSSRSGISYAGGAPKRGEPGTYTGYEEGTP